MVGRRSGHDDERDGARVFADWYGAHHPRMLRALLVLSRDLPTAEEIVAEAFARALERWGRVGSMESPEGWTYQVAVNLLRRRWRRGAIEARLWRRSAAQGFEDPPSPDPDLWAAVQQLPQRAREAIALRYVSGLTEREVAQAMGISEGAASAALVSARRQLAARLESQEEREDAHADT